MKLETYTFAKTFDELKDDFSIQMSRLDYNNSVGIKSHNMLVDRLDFLAALIQVQAVFIGCLTAAVIYLLFFR